jgi:hypothetical protein
VLRHRSSRSKATNKPAASSIKVVEKTNRLSMYSELFSPPR